MIKDSDIALGFVVMLSMLAIWWYLFSINLANANVNIAMFFGTMGFLVLYYRSIA